LPLKTLAQWLDWQSGLNPKSIDLGLERVASIAERLPAKPAQTRVITVGGTNGKGSCVYYLEAILQAAGYRVGAYTSPHLERYNERIRIDGREVDDAALCAAFERVDAARGETKLTYFEFGTLAALDMFWREQLDVVVLEVGLGGRLDAVNLVDADAAIITNIALDHLEWLGPDRESIGAEKAGIFRPGRPAICADRDPPMSLLSRAEEIGADLRRAGRDYDWRRTRVAWRFSARGRSWKDLPWPARPAEYQFGNAAAALAALEASSESIPVSAAAIRAGIRATIVPGRFEVLAGEVDTILDVAHNPDAARALANELARTRGASRTLAVFGMMRDKQVEEVSRILAPEIDGWWLATLAEPRGLDASGLRDAVAKAIPELDSALAESPWQAWLGARDKAGSGDRIVVCGSFVTVGEVRRHWQRTNTGGRS
jgi:dihydrofolate synthase/folylpolyglutamate synthase